MNARWAGLGVCLLLAVAWMSLNTSGCDPCSSCSSSTTHKHPTATPTSTPAPNACLPSSSMAILVQGTNVTSYLPQGTWDGGNAAVNVVPVETSSGLGTGGTPVAITTGSVPNACASNSNTGTTVCTGNNTDVFLINGTTLSSSLTSSATGDESFSGGDCENCGVVVDQTTNKALVALGGRSAGADRALRRAGSGG